MSDKEASDSCQPRYVYLVPQEQQVVPGASTAGEEIDLRALWQTVLAGRWIFLVVTSLFCVAGVVKALTATEWYQADVVLAPVGKKSQSGGLGPLSDLANLSGIEIPSAGSGVSLAVLKSKSFAREFIEDQQLLPVLLPDAWDVARRDWKVQGKARPDIRDGVKYFNESVRTVTEDKKSGLVTLSIKWTSGVVAADWANLLVKRLNDRLRADAIQESQFSIEYLQKEMLATSVISLQQAIGRVLEGEMQQMALARSHKEFAFKVVDAATTPKHRISPKRPLIVVSFALAGLMLSALLVFARAALQKPGQRA